MGTDHGRSRRLVAGLAATALLALACNSGAGSTTPAKPANAASPAASASGGSTSGAAAAPAATAPPALIPARVAYTTIAAVQSPFWIAFDGGYFREQGLDVPDMNRIDPGATLIAALHGGEVDLVAAGGPSLVLGNLQGLETMIVGSDLDVFEDAIAVRPDIKTVEDLRGKTIGVSRLKAISDVAARVALERLGLKPDVDVNFRGTGGNAESLAALQQGSAEGASISVPALFKAESLGFPVLVDITAMKIPFTNGSIGTVKNTIATRADVVERVLKANALATARFKSDPEYAMQIIGKYSDIQDQDALRGTVDVYRPILQTDIYPDRGALQATLDAEENPAARTATPDDVADFSFAEKLRQSGFYNNLPK
ncbi:MAG TPA: ABC transporter substrate-binding protein [Chloroflexota bacterium]|nr:ABC transporter substrate-binding protein [Chloroflexota bacterium]